LRIQTDQASVRRSYIHSESTGPALSVTGSIDVNSELTNTYVEGTQALVAAGLEAVSSVLAGAVSGVTLRCIDTYGADHELLNASCQPQVP
jgi:hypothetical protein